MISGCAPTPGLHFSGICPLAGEKVAVICRRVGARSLKAAYSWSALAAERVGITTAEVIDSTKPCTLPAVIKASAKVRALVSDFLLWMIGRGDGDTAP